MSVFECWRECNGMCSPKIRFKVFCWSSGLSAPWIWFQDASLLFVTIFEFSPLGFLTNSSLFQCLSYYSITKQFTVFITLYITRIYFHLLAVNQHSKTIMICRNIMEKGDIVDSSNDLVKKEWY